MSKHCFCWCFSVGCVLLLTACERPVSPDMGDAKTGPPPAARSGPPPAAESGPPPVAESGSRLVTDLAELSEAESQRPVSTTEPPEAIRRFCSDCHALPQADHFERDVWYEMVRSGYEFYAVSGRTDLQPPPPELVLRYYYENAPERIVFPDPPAIDADWTARFNTTKLDWKDADYIVPAISSIAWIDLMIPGESDLIVTDMRDGSISLVNPVSRTRKVLGRVSNPARVTACDFDGDGLQDLVVSDLGSLRPFDHDLGKVVLLRRLPDSTDFEQIPLLEGIGRVADVAVGNFGGDQKMDLVVSEFGFRYTGGIRLLINRSEVVSKPLFTTRVLDTRPGTVRLLATDWNHDGNLDVTAMISQEFESIELFINHHNRFDVHNAFTAPGPLYGSSGIELVDFDQDGDQDILYTNGDTFDNNYANLSHSVGWLENLGDLRFDHHHLINLPGAFRALASDMDNDGDLDVVVTVLLPAQIKPLSLRHSEPVAIMLLEQTQPLQFTPHVLERGTARYPALEVADFNHDGKMDFAVGSLRFEGETPGSPVSQLPRLTVWMSR